MFDGILHQLLQFLLDVLQAADVVPGDVGHLDDGLAQRARAALGHRVAEVLHGDGERRQYLGVDLVVLQIDQVHLLADLLQGGLRAEGGEVGANVAVRLRSYLLEIDVVRQFHVLGVDAEDLETAGGVRDADVDFSVGVMLSLLRICLLF